MKVKKNPIWLNLGSHLCIILQNLILKITLRLVLLEKFFLIFVVHSHSRPEEEILKSMSIKFEAGKTTAIVGPSGMGKSTVVQLIERFYDPQKGQVTVDGIDVRELNISWWRNMIGVVEQEPSLFNTSIYENIKYGKPDATEKEIHEAAKVMN